ncbi:MFS transporter [Saccharibacillus alkalitolerans]|uniref:MFS transporter n=1 Tax=Saccharibacillus alkalitolerans TaxID=2705290 RepID=A0ABX0FDJ5_9BACL|nr:MFS transporter [Saccharibacillus alkalitolerans]NGZ77606.1 MFS transporter [Saccharibacillus alkalitolerans]
MLSDSVKEAHTDEASAASRLSVFLSPLRRSKAFTYLWLGQWIAMLGSSVSVLILPLVVYSLTDSSTALGLAMTCYMLPNILALPFAGLIVDKTDRLRLVMLSNSARLIIMLLAAVSIFNGSLTLERLYIGLVFYGLMEGVFNPAYSALRAEVFTPDIRNAANALSQISIQGVRLLGPALGGMLVSAASPGAGFALDSVTYLISLICFMMLGRVLAAQKGRRGGFAARPAEPERSARTLDPSASGAAESSRSPEAAAGPTTAPGAVALPPSDSAELARAVSDPRRKPADSSSVLSGFGTEFMEGVRVLSRLPWLWITIVAFSLLNICYTGIVAILVPWLFKVHHGLSPSVYGVAMAGTAVGAILAAVLFGSKRDWKRRGLVAYGGALLSGVALLLLSIVTWVPGLVMAMVLEGFGMMMFMIIWEISLQELVPAESFGRVASLDMLGSFALLPVGYLIVGRLADTIGGIPSIAIFACAGLAILLTALCSPHIRNFN